MTDREVVDGCNALARLFYLRHGCVVEPGYRFDSSGHPQERMMWDLAATAYERLLHTDAESALSNLEDA